MQKAKTCRVCGEKLPSNFIVDRCIRCALKADAGKMKVKRNRCIVCGHVGIGKTPINNGDGFACSECYNIAKR